MQEISIPDSVTVIEQDAFSGCLSLQKIHISDELFKKYKSYIPDTAIAATKKERTNKMCEEAL